MTTTLNVTPLDQRHLAIVNGTFLQAARTTVSDDSKGGIMSDTMVATYASYAAIRHALDLSNYMVENLEFDTLSGSTYELRRGMVSGGCLSEPHYYNKARIVTYIDRHNEVSFKLGVFDDYGRIVLTSPVLRVRVTLR